MKRLGTKHVKEENMKEDVCLGELDSPVRHTRHTRPIKRFMRRKEEEKGKKK